MMIRTVSLVQVVVVVLDWTEMMMMKRTLRTPLHLTLSKQSEEEEEVCF